MEKITKYPLFGKAYLTEDVLGGISYCPPGHNYTVSPAIDGGWLKQEVDIEGNTPTRTFSSGSSFMDWTCRNCEQCKKWNNETSNPDDIRQKGGCALELRLALAYMDDGKIPFKTAKRIGFRSVCVTKSGVGVAIGNCKEFQPK